MFCFSLIYLIVRFNSKKNLVIKLLLFYVKKVNLYKEKIWRIQERKVAFSSTTYGDLINSETNQNKCRLKRVNTPHYGKGHSINHNTNINVTKKLNFNSNQNDLNQQYYAKNYATPQVTVFSTQKDCFVNYSTSASTSFSAYPKSSSYHHQPSIITDGMIKVELSLVVGYSISI